MTLCRNHKLRPALNATVHSALVALMSVALLTGCGAGGEGPERFTVSGNITYEGQPVPTGFIKFAPDTSKGNSGPGGGAPIKDGRFKTPRDKGLVGGSYTITITGSDGVPTTEGGEEIPEGKPLFRAHRVQHDFPNEDTEWNFQVPSD